MLCAIHGDSDCAWFNVSRQHSIGYTGDGFYRSKDPTNSTEGTHRLHN